MSRLKWEETPRTYENGVDRGVLFFGTTARPVGVTWGGLLGVDEAPSGGEAKAYYLDGVKYLNVPSPTEYKATIRAVTYPIELDRALGNAPLYGNALYAADQPIRPFDFSYRTRIGNSEDPDYAYKIHLVYNALISPSSAGYDTRSDSAAPINFSWNITTTPIQVPGMKPTAHIVADSRYTTEAKMDTLKDIIYGTISTDPLMPTVAELASIFGGV